MQGLVIRNTGSAYTVMTDDRRRHECKVKGTFRLKGIRSTNPVAVGDRVTFDGGFITEICNRRNYIIRRASNLSKQTSILAANIDRAFLVATIAHPTTSTTFIDRFLASAEAYGVPVTIIFNKTDLLDSEQLAQLAQLERLYQGIGYATARTVATQGVSPTLAPKGSVSLFAGNSGVGKSTLLNALIPGLNLKTAAISEAHDTGTHTTTFSEMFETPDGSWVIDTPGVRGFGTFNIERKEAGHFFPEIFAASSHCRFGGCTHTHEPGCNVLQALSDGLIAPSRYNSYLSILEDQSAGKYR